MDTKSCSFYIRAIYHSLERVGECNNEPYPLNSSQYSILVLLAESSLKEMSLGEIRNELNLSQTGVAKLTTQLEQYGFIKKFTDEKDRRVKKVSLLEKGRNYCARTTESVLNREALLLEGLSEEDCIRLKECLTIMYRNSCKLDTYQP